VGEVETWHLFLIMELGPEDVVLGLPWLRSINLKIDWAGGKMRIDPLVQVAGRAKAEQVMVNQAQ
jgi:hypothetical protein